MDFCVTLGGDGTVAHTHTRARTHALQLDAYDAKEHAVDFCVTLGGDGTVAHTHTHTHTHTRACTHALQLDAYDAKEHAVDFCVTLGGDGTVLHLASLFEHDDPLPPIISFAMGSL